MNYNDNNSENIFRANTRGYLQHGYQPMSSDGKKSISEGYIPNGRPINGQSSGSEHSKPPKGGSAQQDR